MFAPRTGNRDNLRAVASLEGGDLCRAREARANNADANDPVTHLPVLFLIS
jgi:hypothetical protein